MMIMVKNGIPRYLVQSDPTTTKITLFVASLTIKHLVFAMMILRTVLAMFGKLFASSSFSLVYMYTAELYPTTIRSSGVGVCSLMARIGGFSAPFIATSLPKVRHYLIKIFYNHN